MHAWARPPETPPLPSTFPQPCTFHPSPELHPQTQTQRQVFVMDAPGFVRGAEYVVVMRTKHNAGANHCQTATLKVPTAPG